MKLPDKKFIAMTIEIIEANYDNKDFGCPELCEALGMSRSHIHRKIKKAFNTSTSGFILQIRMEKAKEFLMQKNQKISSIAHKVGFSDANYFSRSFSTFYGISPIRYRQMLMKSRD
ncbi:helix-turn-helix transcriptional regulator [Emticicia sp. BO119]|nr:helix-turn-helix transcriptional regulator [Emticicia sp. BO119]